MFKNRYKAIGTILKMKPGISSTPTDLDGLRYFCKIFKKNLSQKQEIVIKIYKIATRGGMPR
jgi:hypothetical protein